MGHGGGIITKKMHEKIGAVAIAMCVVFCLMPVAMVAETDLVNNDGNQILQPMRHLENNAQEIKTVNTVEASQTQTSTRSNRQVRPRSRQSRRVNSRSNRQVRPRSRQSRRVNSRSNRQVRPRARAAILNSAWLNSGRGVGDCWVNSDVLFNRLSSQGQRVRIIQYRTSLSPRHRSVQVYQNGAWVDFDYRAHGYARRYFATRNKPGKFVVRSN